MKIKNYELKGFIEFIMNLDGVKPKLSRMRVRFAKLAQAHMSLVEEERIGLAKHFAKRDDNNNAITNIDKDGNETIELGDVNGFYTAMQELMEESFYVEETQENKDILLGIKELILESELSIGGGQEAIDHDRWCEIVEEINYD